jgi:hypothetical protein
VIGALMLAGLLDPNCIPRHHPRAPAARSRDVSVAAAFQYRPHSHYYHAPLPPACREPWPEMHLHDVPVSDFPHPPLPAPAPHSIDLGHSPLVIWPGYVPNPPARQPHGGPGTRPATVSVPEPATLPLFGLGIGLLLARGWSNSRSYPRHTAATE